MYGITPRSLKYVAAVALGVSVCSPVLAQGRSKDGQDRSGRGGASVSRSDSGRSFRDGTRSVSPRTGSGETIRSDARDGTSAFRRDSGGRDGIADRGRSRDDGNWRHGDGRWHHDHDGDNHFSFGFGLGPFYGFWGPRYGYYNPWYGYYGPSYGYFGPWSGTYVQDWPYYYDSGIAGSAYYEAESMRRDAPPDDVATRARGSERSESATTQGFEFQRRAEAAFRAGRYDEAIRMANHAAVEMPNNGKLFLLLGQALFAVGDYGAAAGAIHQGVAMSDPKSWGTIVQNFRRYYGNGSDYTEQLRRLEKFAQDHPDASYAHFLLGYHYGYLGYPAEARRELAEAARLEERDELTRDLLAQFGGEAPRNNRSVQGERAGGEAERTARQEDRDVRRDGRSSERREPRPSQDDESESRGRESSDRSYRSAPPPE